MPLKKGRNKRTITKNIRELMATGRSRDQAIAIALDAAGKSRRKKRRRKK